MNWKNEGIIVNGDICIATYESTVVMNDIINDKHESIIVNNDVWIVNYESVIDKNELKMEKHTLKTGNYSIKKVVSDKL